MPRVQKYIPGESAEQPFKAKTARQLLEEQYDALLRDFDAGEYGEAEVGPNESRVVVRNHLRSAAGRRGLLMSFLEISDARVCFRIRGHVVPSAAGPVTLISAATPALRSRER